MIDGNNVASCKFEPDGNRSMMRDIFQCFIQMQIMSRQVSVTRRSDMYLERNCVR